MSHPVPDGMPPEGRKRRHDQAQPAALCLQHDWMW